jgi:hypothetical protein
MSIIKP